MCWDHNKPPGVFSYDDLAYSDTSLTIVANATTAGHFYWAKITYDKKLLDTKTSNVNVLESSKTYLILDGMLMITFFLNSFVISNFQQVHFSKYVYKYFCM